MSELVRYYGWNRKTHQWEFLVVTDGWINHSHYKKELRRWDKTYTCFAIQAWTRKQQKAVEKALGI